jgi:ABC-type multidrug transport system fused ATPase/permease subunit
MTLRENVAMSNAAAISDDHSIIQALREADFVYDEAQMKLDTTLGTEFGDIDLSGGQWQKLAIARGIFRPSELIVLDEPTSAIDPIAETEILRGFLKMAKDKTAIIVSHRTGLCAMVDKVAVMKDGRIVEFGAHEALLEADGEYARLFGAQSQWYV